MRIGQLFWSLATVALFILGGCSTSQEYDWTQYELRAGVSPKYFSGSTQVIFLKPSFDSNFSMDHFAIKTNKEGTVPITSLGHGVCKLGTGPGLIVYFHCDMANIPAEVKEVSSVFDFRIEGHHFILKSVFVRQADGEWKSDEKRLTLKEVPWAEVP